MGREYRSRSRILLEILRAMKDEPGIGVSALLTRANLSTARLEDYLDELVGQGLVRMQAGTRRTFHLDHGGQRLLTELDRLDRFMADFGMEM